MRDVIEKLMPAAFSVLVVLHMPAGFTRSFAEQLSRVNGWQACEAADGQRLATHTIYVAPGDSNMTVEKKYGAFFIRLAPHEKSDIFKPNINKTFASLGENAGTLAIGVIMTGMGNDGAGGLLIMRQAGAVTIAQSKETCVINSMPIKAVEAGAVDHIVPLEHIAAKVMQLV